MHLFVPYDGSSLARVALYEACRMATPIDRITVMIAVLVPRQYAVDVPVGFIWRETTRADRLLKEAYRFAERASHYGATLHGVQVQARTVADAILAGAAHYHADSILFAVAPGPRGRVATLFGTVPTVIRHAPCDVRVLYVTRPGHGDWPDGSDIGERHAPAEVANDAASASDTLSEPTAHDDSVHVEGVGKSDV